MNRKLALITGASRGIGRKTAELFAKNNYELILVCHKNKNQLEETAQKIIETDKTNCITFCGDMGNYDTVQSLYHTVQACFGKCALDVIVNNAGISHIGLFTQMSPAEWDQMIASNLSSVFYICRNFVPDMIRVQHGHIINVSSVWGTVGASCEAAYSAAKGGVNTLTRAMAKELAPSHICVNAAAFGAIDTDMNAWMDDAEHHALIDEIPACRMGTATEAAELILKISQLPEYVTGQVITMDGGWI